VLDCLEAAWLEGGVWKKEVLEEGNVADSILTASGESVYCFYVKKKGEGAYEVRYRRWRKGVWEPSRLVVTEPFRINHVAAPQACPPGYACVFWDEFISRDKKKTRVRFFRVPNSR